METLQFKILNVASDNDFLVSCDLIGNQTEIKCL